MAEEQPVSTPPSGETNSQGVPPQQPDPQPAPTPVTPNPAPPNPGAPSDIADASAKILAEVQSLKAQLEDTLAKAQGANQPAAFWPNFFSSGPFFILLGLGLLVTAALGLGVVHTTFSFVLVVLGIAILLYGTGTQGMARFDTDANSARYNVALAGGAGVLAFCVALGIVKYYDKMQLAFNLQTKYVIAVLKPKKDGSSTFENYFHRFDIEGNPVPAMTSGDNILVFVPFRESQGDAIQRVTYTLKHTDTLHRSSLLREKLTAEFQIKLADAKPGNGGYDFPLLRLEPPIDMVSPDISRANANSAVSEESAKLRGLKPAPNTDLPASTEPAKLIPE